MISLLHRFLLSYTLLPFGFCLNDTTLLSFQIRSNDINEKEKNENTMPDTDKEEIINSIDSSFMSTFSTKLNIGTEN